MPNGLDLFKSRFHFNPALDGHVGVEREWFIVERKSGLIVPRAPDVIAALGGVSDTYTYELSACQGESRHGPCKLTELRTRLIETDALLQSTLKTLGLRAEYRSVAPPSIPLTVYPDERYDRLVKSMPRKRLAAACRIAGTHVHVGQRDHDAALLHYRLRHGECEEFVRLGNLSGGARFRLYETVQPGWRPRQYQTWDAFYRDAIECGFAENPRDNWQIIRLTGKGTLEYRMFDATNDVDMIVEWAYQCTR